MKGQTVLEAPGFKGFEGPRPLNHKGWQDGLSRGHDGPRCNSSYKLVGEIKHHHARK